MQKTGWPVAIRFREMSVWWSFTDCNIAGQRVASSLGRLPQEVAPYAA